MPDLRKIIGETQYPEMGVTVWGVLAGIVEPTEPSGIAFADLMIAAIADRVAAALVSDEAVYAAAKALCARCGVNPDSTTGGTWDGGWYPPNEHAWKTWADDARAALQAAAKTTAVNGEEEFRKEAMEMALENAKLREVVARLTRERDEARAVLRQVEWFAYDHDCLVCPSCAEWQGNGHASDCALAAALSDFPAEKDASAPPETVE